MRNYPSTYKGSVFDAQAEIQTEHPHEHIEHLYGHGSAAPSELPEGAVIVGHWGLVGKGLSRATFYYIPKSPKA